jgi:hypothetical protein
MENYDETLFKYTLPLHSVGKPAEDSACNYYHEYCRLFLANVVLTSQVCHGLGR